MGVNDKDIKTLCGQFLAEFDQDAAGETWAQQSEEFKEFWDEMLPSKEKLDTEDVDHYICFLDSNAKGIRDTDIEPAGRVLIPQGGWRRIFEEFKGNKKLYQLVTLILRCDSDEEQIELLNKLYSINTERNRLTGSNANMISDLMFVYNPMKNISMFSLSHRYKIIEVFELGNVSSMKQKSWGEQIVLTRNAILAFQKEHPFKNLRSLSRFFYYSPVKELWSGQEVVSSSEDVDFDERLEEEGFFDIPLKDRKIITEPGDLRLCRNIPKIIALLI